MNEKLMKNNIRKSSIILALFGMFLVAILLLSGCVQEQLAVPPLPEIPYIPEGTPRGWQATYTEIYSNDFESSPSPGLRLNGGKITTEEAIDGKKSVKLSNWKSVETNPNELALSPDTYYTFEFDYQIINPGTSMNLLETYFSPKGSTDVEDSMLCRSVLSNAESGTFSSGGLTGTDAPAYYLSLAANEGASIIIDNLKIFRLDTLPITSPPSRWANLSQLPYPRLGNYQGYDANCMAKECGVAPDWPEGEFVYQVEEIEDRLAFFDVIAAPGIPIQTSDTSFVKRLREKNPNIVIVPYDTVVVSAEVCQPPHATIDKWFDFYHDPPQEWMVKYTDGTNVPLSIGWPGRFHPNIYETCPVVNGQNYTDAYINWVVNDIMASGVWDGIFFDNCIARTSFYVPNSNNPSLINFDINNNGQRDETLAQISEMARTATIKFLQGLRSKVGDNELIIPNEGWNPDLCIAPYVNGYLFEGWGTDWFDWDGNTITRVSEAAWARSLMEYLTAGKTTMAPHLNILEASGAATWIANVKQNYLEPTEKDFRQNRFIMASALLGDGFYEYDLLDMRSAPYLFDEFTVNENGVATEDRQYKGYLGMALGDALELSSPATVIWEEDFETGTLPSEIEGTQPDVYVSSDADDVINGTASMVIYNPDHTNYKEFTQAITVANKLTFDSGKTYVVEFDWEILETIDGWFSAGITGSEDGYSLPEVIAGESGRAHFPATLNYGNNFKLEFMLNIGGGKVAIDNIHITEGGAGPWRRDFENGFVLVNPINKAYTFSAADISGDWSRTGIKRILGMQTPDINNGQPVTDTLTLQPFDAIILLADHISSS